jgi:uncharacterized membrane protein
MRFFIPEAFISAFKLSLSVCLSWLLINAYASSIKEGVRSQPNCYFRHQLLIALLFLVILFLSGTYLNLDAYYKDLIRRFSAYTFGILYIGAVFSGWSLKDKSLISLSPLLLFSPPFLLLFLFGADTLSLSFFLKDLSAMRQNYEGTYTGAIFGTGAGALLLIFSSRLVKGLSLILSFTGLLFSLSIIKLLFGGTGGYAELSLIPSVQRGLMKFFHDFVHQLFVFFMVPDHPLLKTTVWNFIGLIFGESFTMFVTLLILIVPSLIILFKILRPPEVIPEGFTGARKRKYIHDFMTMMRLKAVPLIVFIMVVTLLWFFKAESGPGLYIPQPVPVVEDNGFIVLNLNEPGRSIGDGNIHKFIFKKEGQNYRFFVFKRPDGRFAVCLDACEICPPEGYGQARAHLVCIYCNTPIPLNTVGEPGGCNPIPINFSLRDKEIRIEVQEILKKWRLVHSGVSKE